MGEENKVTSASQAVEAAKATISGDNPAQNAADNQETGPDAAEGLSQGSGQPDGQKGSADDNILNIKNVPPELRPHLDNMVKAYRQKTEELPKKVQAEVAKAVEAFKQKAEQYDALASDEEAIRALEELYKRRNAPDLSQDPVKGLEEKLKSFEERQQFQEQVKELTEEVVAFESEIDEKTKKPVRPDFAKLSEIVIGETVENGKKTPLSLMRVAVAAAPGETPREKLANGYAAVKKWHDSIFEEGKKAGMGRLQQKSAATSIPPSGSFAPSGRAGSPAKSALEAIQLARQGLSPA